MSNNDSMIENIRILGKDIDKKAKELKLINEQVTGIIVNAKEYKDVSELEDDLVEARKKLKIALESSPAYTNLMESAGKLREELKDDREVLSGHVVEYYAESREVQVEMDDTNGDAREIIVTGRLGKQGKLQTNIFTHGGVD